MNFIVIPNNPPAPVEMSTEAEIVAIAIVGVAVVGFFWLANKMLKDNRF